MKKYFCNVLFVLGLFLCVFAGTANRTYAASAPSVVKTEAIIYAMDDWAYEYINIPKSYPESFQIQVKNANDVYYYVESGRSVTVSDTGLVTPNVVTMYWYSAEPGYSYGSTVLDPDRECIEITHEVEYGESVIRVVADKKHFYITVKVEDYAQKYADSVIDQYVAENFSEDMSTEEVMDTICRFPAGYNYSPYYSGATGMVISGGGDCWASTGLILEVCERLDIEAIARNGNRDNGSGSGHVNALVIVGDGDYYELEAGYVESAPRYYSIMHRTSLFSYRFTGDGVEVYQYDGELNSDSVLEIPRTLGSVPVVSIGDRFISQSSVKKVVIPDTVIRIGDSAFNGCSNLETLHIPASVMEIGDFAFTACVSLENFTCSSNNPVYAIRDNVLYNKTLTTVLCAPSCASVSLPSSVTTIGSYAFYCNSNIKIIDVPASVKTLEEGALARCYNLESVVLRSVDAVSDYACAENSCAVYFLGDAPDFSSSAFYSATVSVHYLKTNKTWTTDVIHSVSNHDRISWVAEKGILAVTQHPLSTSVLDGEVAKCAVKVVGDGLKYQWYVAAAGKETYIKSSVVTETYSCKMNASNDGRRVYCVITDGFGNTVKSDTVVLSMKRYAKIVAQPKKAYARNGAKVSIPVTATGDGLTYQWYVKNEGAKSYGKSSCTGPTYSCTMSETANNRMVYCVVTDQYGNSVKTNTVYLKMLASIITQPKSTTAFDGNVAKVAVKAGGNGLTYTWYVKNAGATKYSKSSVKTATYSCVMNEQNDGRQVYCVVTDQYGKTATTQVATLSLSRTAKVLTQPKTGYARYGKVVSVSVGAEGDGLTYTWYVKNEGASKYTKSSITGSTYAVKMTSAVNNRQVYCVVKDQYGNTVKTKTVALRMMASIVKQPASVTVANGAKAAVTVNADGNGLTYTWYVKNPGATKFTKSSVTGATYSCIMSAKNNGRQVYCVVTDQYGKTVTSNVVTLGMK